MNKVLLSFSPLWEQQRFSSSSSSSPQLFPGVLLSSNIFYTWLILFLLLCNRFMEGDGINKEEEEAASSTCNKVAASLQDDIEILFITKNYLNFPF